MAGGQLIFQLPKFDWHAEDQQQAFDEWKGQITLALRASSIKKDIWFATIIGYLGKEGFRRWNTLPISKDEAAQKDPEAVFQAIAETLEVSTSYWNHIDEIYSDIKQGDDESIDKLDQCIKNLVEKCQYTEAEKLVCRTELLFHATKHFEVKKWVRSKKRWEDMTYQALLQYAKEHEMTVKDFNHHKSNGGIAQPMTINAIESFKCGKKGSRNGSSNGASSLHRGSTDKPCSKCNTTHMHTRNAQHLAKSAISVVTKIILVHVAGQMWAKAKDAGVIEHKLSGRSPERCHWPSRGRCSRSRSRSWSRSSNESVTRSTHSINQYNIDDIDVVKMFHSIYRSRTVASRSNDTDPDGKTKIITRLRIKLPHRQSSQQFTGQGLTMGLRQIFYHYIHLDLCFHML